MDAFYESTPRIQGQKVERSVVSVAMNDSYPTEHQTKTIKKAERVECKRRVVSTFLGNSLLIKIVQWNTRNS